MGSWVPGAEGSGFDDDHLPYGTFDDGHGRRVGVRIGNRVLDLAAMIEGIADNPDVTGLLAVGSLDALLAAGPAAWAAVRDMATRAVTDPNRRAAVEPHLHLITRVRLVMPFTVADYVDFYASEWHATAVGRMFRPDADPLPPNWKHLPIGYHGRAGTVVVSGTPDRPAVWADPDTRRLPDLRPDDEIGRRVRGRLRGRRRIRARHPGAGRGLHPARVRRVPAQRLERPRHPGLGVPAARPDVGKSFATAISPWITPLAALAAARIDPPPRTHRLLPYLADGQGLPWGLDLRLAVELNGPSSARPPFAAMYWTGPQLMAHLTVERGRTAHRRPVRVGHGVRPGPGTGRLVAGTVGQRHPADPARGRLDADVPAGRRHRHHCGRRALDRRGPADPRRGDRPGRRRPAADRTIVGVRGSRGPPAPARSTRTAP